MLALPEFATLSSSTISSRVRSSKKEFDPRSSTLNVFESRFRVFVVYLVFIDLPDMQAFSLQIHPSDRVDESFVERKGIEPLTLGLQSRCSPS